MANRILSAICIFTMLLSASESLGDTYVVPLNVSGSYNMGQSKSIEFDLGVQLYQVQSVRFVCAGNVTAGLNYSFQPYGDYFGCFLNAEPYYMYAVGPTVGASTYPSPQYFSGQYLFNPFIGDETWNFLLDGHATGYVKLATIYSIPEFPPYSYPHGYLDSASIIIEATPVCPTDNNLASYEPSSVCLSVTTQRLLPPGLLSAVSMTCLLLPKEATS